MEVVGADSVPASRHTLANGKTVDGSVTSLWQCGTIVLDRRVDMKLLLVVIMVSISLSPGELFGASICVNVTDPADLPLPSALINVVSLSDPEERFTISADKSGRACREEMAEGLYSVEASLEGFMSVRYYPVSVVFPFNVELDFRLPFGEIGEGGYPVECLLSGTLRKADQPLAGAKICLYQLGMKTPTGCTLTNGLGQYALNVQPAVYNFEIRRLRKLLHRGSLDMSVPGHYRNRLRLDKSE
jgi:hypothetical protein